MPVVQRHAVVPRGAAKMDRIEARLSRDTKHLIQRAAALRGTTVSDFMVNSAAREAEQVVQAHNVFELSERDSLAFAHALENPREPSVYMREAVRRHAELFGE